jgi:outer membrane receptor protein involved in Fe transport
MKLNRKQLSLAIARALSAGAVAGMAAPMVYAQAPAPAAAEPQKLERIEVTGSRIPSQTLTSESPVTVINAQDIRWTGLTSTADIINQLPQAFADQGNMLSNGSSGTATINLRDLGAARTLVLVNGRRLPAGSPVVGGWPTDINAIPAPLIQRVEVLTGGASAVYGSDAVAGVVNFIMNDHFEGAEFSWNGNGYNHQQQGNQIADTVATRSKTNPGQFQVPGNVDLDGRTQSFSMTLGSNFANNKGNATVFFEWLNTDAVLQGTRNFSACAAGSDANGLNCGGSSTSYQGRFFDLTTGSSKTILNAAGDVRGYSAALDQFNFGPYNYYQRPDTRYLFDAFAHYDALPNVRVYTEFMFMDDTTTSQIAPSGIFFGQPFALSAANPLLSPAFKTAFGMSGSGPAPTDCQTDNPSPGCMYIGRRNLEGGGRQEYLRHTDYRFVIGGKGDILDNKWSYDFWWQNGKVIYAEEYLNDFSKTRITRALDVVKDPTTGLPVCASKLNGTDPLCVPYDIFHTGGVTPAALNYLQTAGFQNGYTSQSVVGLNLSSDLGTAYGWTLPWAKNGIGLAVGAERRVEKLQLNTDTFFSTFDGAGQGGPVIGLSGQYTVSEFYGELRVPIMERQPWAYDLSVSGSYRYSNYSTDQTTNSYGLGAEWAPVKEGKLRASYQQAVRAANIVELFAAQGLNLFNMSHDPCAGNVPGQLVPTATLAQCLRTGLPASKYGSALIDSPAGQYNYLQGGNPSLEPETAKTYSVGIVLQPMNNLSATIDYWNIKVENQIGIVPSATAITQCIASGQFCDLIHRDVQGSLWLSGGGFVTGTNQNLGSIQTSGIDLTFNYTQPIQNYGSLGFSLTGTWLDTFEVEQIPGLGTYDCAGLYGNTCGTPLPEWRHKFGVTWNTPWSWNAFLAWRYFSKVNIDASSSNPQLNAPYNSVNGSLAAQNYIDLAFQWNATKNLTVRAGVNNVFDKDPPIIDSAIAGPPYGNGNTYPQVYDTLGRNFFLNLTAKF